MQQAQLQDPAGRHTLRFPRPPSSHPAPPAQGLAIGFVLLRVESLAEESNN